MYYTKLSKCTIYTLRYHFKKKIKYILINKKYIRKHLDSYRAENISYYSNVFLSSLETLYYIYSAKNKQCILYKPEFFCFMIYKLKLAFIIK